MNKFARVLAPALLTLAFSASQMPAPAQTTGRPGSSGKIYEPLDPPSVSSIPDPARSMFDDMERFQREMDEFFARQFDAFAPLPAMPRMPAFGNSIPAWGRLPGPLTSFSAQATNIREENGRYVVDLHLPDSDLPGVDVKIEGRQLRITGQRREQNDQTAPGMQSRSFITSTFQQSYTLPGPVKAEAMRVERDRGRLKITVPKI